MKKKAIAGKIAILAAVLVFSLSMTAGCGRSDDRSSDEVDIEQTADPAGMVHLEGADDVSAFMDEVYGGVAEELLPMNLMTTELDKNDNEMTAYHTGLTELDGIEGVYLSESMMSSVAYSAIYIRTNDEADAAAIRQQLMDSVNPAKWVCVTAEKQYAVIIGSDIFFVMGAPETAEAVLNSAKAAAGARGMKVADTVEKTNPV